MDVTAQHYLVALLEPYLSKRTTEGRFPRIIFVSSTKHTSVPSLGTVPPLSFSHSRLTSFQNLLYHSCALHLSTLWSHREEENDTPRPSSYLSSQPMNGKPVYKVSQKSSPFLLVRPSCPPVLYARLTR